MEHFTVIVAGESPDKLLSAYDSNKKVDKYVVYEFARAEEYRQMKINAYSSLLNADISEADKQFVKDCIEEWKAMSVNDFFLDISAGYDFDEETGDAVSTENPDGKYVSINNPPKYTEGFMLKNGSTAYSAKKGNIDWERLTNTKPNEIAWETVVEHKTPVTEEEKAIFENMKDKNWYFSLFKDKEDFIKSVSSFWATAFLSKETGWVELEYNVPQFEWTKGFFDRFIAALPNDTLLTIYECVRS